MTWRKVKLGEVLARVRNLVEIEDDKEYKLVTVRLHHKGVTLRRLARGNELNSTKMHSVKAGDFILSGIDARHGAFGIIPDELDGAVVTNDFWCLGLDKNVIDRDLFLKLTSTSYFDDLCKKASDGTTNRVRLQADRFYNLEIDLPSIEKQKKLIEEFQKLETTNSQIAYELSHQLDLVSQLRQAFLREAMQGKLVPQDVRDEPAEILLEKIKAEKAKLIAEKKIKKEKPIAEIKAEEIPFAIPNSWLWCRLGSIVESMNNGLYKPEEFYNTSGIACLRMYNIQAGQISFHKLKRMVLTDAEVETYSLRKGDLLLNRVNSVELLGKAAYIDEPRETLVYESKNIRARLIEKSITPKFVNCIFLTNIIREQILRNFKKVTGQASINQEQLSSFVIPLPPLAEQKRIVEKLEKLMAYCDELEANIRTSKGHETLLQVALEPR